MPRQILPGLHFKQWVPPIEATAEQRKDYVFPELVIGDEIPDDRWNDWAWIKENCSPNDFAKRVLRETLDQLLYNSLIAMMNNSWDSIKFKDRSAFEATLLDLTIKQPDDIYKSMAVEAMIYRVAACEPHGHYVWK